jgi:hypothetical protein
MCTIRSNYSYESRDVEELNDGCTTDIAFLVGVTSQVNILTKSYKVEKSSLWRFTTI